MEEEYKPNIYPVMYWAIAYGVIAGVILLVVWWLSSFITLLWAPVFLAGAIWGAYRNYQKQKGEWQRGQGTAPEKKSPLDEFRDAARDIVLAGREMMAEQRVEDATVAQDTAVEEEALAQAESEAVPDQPVPVPETPSAPQAPPVPVQQPVPPQEPTQMASSSLPPLPPPPNFPTDNTPNPQDRPIP